MNRSLLATLGVVSPLLVGPALAQEPLLRPAREMLVAGPALLWDVELVDVDGDGDLDLYTDGEPFQFPPGAGPKLYLYDDLGGFRELDGAVDPAVGGEPHSDLAFADLDGDGDADAYRVSWFSSRDQVLLGDGSGKLVQASGAPLAGDTPWAVALADLDLDGDVDAVSDDSQDGIFGSTNGLRVQVNGGAATFATSLVALRPEGTGKGGDIAVGDVDEDGLPDLVLALSSSPRLVLNGPGLALAPAPAAIPVDGLGHEVELGDLDGDGHLDLVFGTHAPFLPDVAPDLAYRGDGLGTFTLAGVLPGGARATTALDLDDMDGDGDLDVVLASSVSSGLPGVSPPGRAGQALLRNDGGFGFIPVPAAFESLALDCDALALGDVDQDGDADAVVAQDSMQSRLLLGDGALGFAEVSTALPWSGADGALLLADLDGDGDLDGWASLAEAQVQRNPGNGVLVPDPAATAGAVPPVEGAGSFAVAFDCNGDGALDIYQARGTFLDDKLYVNDGAGAFTLLDTPGFSSLKAAAGDVDGDGDADLVLDGSHLLHGNGAGGFIPWPLVLGTAQAAALADLDLDGDLDLVRGFSFAVHAPVWNPYVGPGFGPDMPLGPPVAAVEAATLDLEGDGDADVLFATEQGPVLMRNDGAGVFTDVTTTLPAHAVIYASPHLAVADLDGDGDQDFVATTNWPFSAEKYFVYLNHQGAFVDGTASVWADIEGPTGFAVGDVDRDVDVDFVATEFSGRLRVVTNHARQLAWRGLPRAGKDLALDVSGPGGEPWALALSPGTASIPLAPFGVLQLDPAGLKVIAGGVLDGNGQAAAVGLMPPTPGAVGLTVYCQAIVGFAPRFTNLEIVTLTAY